MALSSPASAAPTPELVAIAPLLARLDGEQRAAALLPDGPALVIAPAGSGKTTTLIARLGVLLARGVAADRIAVVTFNRAAAEELSARIAERLAPCLPGAAQIEVRTLHALARQVRLDAGPLPELIADRLPLLRAARRRVARGRSPSAPPLPEAEALDTTLSAWKIEGRPPPAASRPILDAYAALLAARGACDFDDLVAGAVERLEADPRLRLRWQARFSHLAVDEFQDVDATQLRLVRLLAEPERNLTVVGDDDQTIYAWRLADVRRILGFEAEYPGARVVQLATNYRCPPAVVHASRRLIETNRERFPKRIVPPPGLPRTRARGRPAIEALSGSDEAGAERIAAIVSAAARRSRAAVLARTAAELTPVMLALLRRGVPHHATVAPPLENDAVRRLLHLAREQPSGTSAFGALLSLRAMLGWRRGDEDDALSETEHAALDALLGWSVAFPHLAGFLAAAHVAAGRLAALRDPSSAIELLTVHGAKGREWPLVVVIGFEADRFPNRRALLGAADPQRAMEEERRLAYVALTRARERLVLAFDAPRPSPFLAEMGYRPTSAATADR